MQKTLSNTKVLESKDYDFWKRFFWKIEKIYIGLDCKVFEKIPQESKRLNVKVYIGRVPIGKDSAQKIRMGNIFIGKDWIEKKYNGKL